MKKQKPIIISTTKQNKKKTAAKGNIQFYSLSLSTQGKTKRIFPLIFVCICLCFKKQQTKKD